MNTIKFVAAAVVDKGRVRKNNEDNLYFDGIYLTEENRDLPQKYKIEGSSETAVFGVFDGMGGEELGELASLITAQTTEELKGKFDGDVNAAVSEIVKKANDRICKKILENNVDRIGATLAMVCIKDDIARVYNIGDSRVYILRKGKLTQISVDDTAVQRLVDLGMITKAASRTHADRHKITQHLGIFEEDLIIEEHRSGKIIIEKDDKIILCSDGLTDMLNNDEIEKIAKQDKATEDVCNKLMETALDKGGRDNTTIIVIEVMSDSATRKKANKLSIIKSFAVVAAVLALIAVVFLFVKGNIEEKNRIKEVEQHIILCDNLSWTNPISIIKVGDKNTLLVGVEPANVTGNVEFNSSDSSVVMIDTHSGSYSALKPGKVTITASLDGVTIELSVRVEE